MRKILISAVIASALLWSPLADAKSKKSEYVSIRRRKMVIDATNKPHTEKAVGKIQLIHDYDEYWDRTGKGKDYISPILESPTWKEILEKAEDAVQTTGDFTHIFLENIHEMTEKTLLALGTAERILPVPEGVRIFRLSFGS